jgi:hypothetical protein
LPLAERAKGSPGAEIMMLTEWPIPRISTTSSNAMSFTRCASDVIRVRVSLAFLTRYARVSVLFSLPRRRLDIKLSDTSISSRIIMIKAECRKYLTV